MCGSLDRAKTRQSPEMQSIGVPKRFANYDLSQPGTNISRAKARIVKIYENASMVGLNKLENDTVVKEINVCPLDSLADIVVLLLFERQLNEYLLQLLVAVVDDKLLEAVFLKLWWHMYMITSPWMQSKDKLQIFRSRKYRAHQWSFVAICDSTPNRLCKWTLMT